MRIVKLVNGKLVTEEVKGEVSKAGDKKRWYEIPNGQYDSLLAIAKKDGLDLDADTDRSRTVKENKAVSTIINLVVVDFMAKRKEMEDKAPGKPGAIK